MHNNFKYFFYLFFFFFILIGCQLQDPDQNHGIVFLENRSKKLTINKSNKNDVIKIIGQPHSESINNDDIWIYLERVLSKGKYHKLGRHNLKANNVLVLSFDKFGVLKSKDFYNKENIKKIVFSEKFTKNELTKKSFVETFLNSIKSKMYRNKNN